MSLSKRLLGETIYTFLQRKTFYGQFIGGNSPEELAELVDKLKLDGIGPLLAVPMEDDAGGSSDFRYCYIDCVCTIVKMQTIN